MVLRILYRDFFEGYPALAVLDDTPSPALVLLRPRFADTPPRVPDTIRPPLLFDTGNRYPAPLIIAAAQIHAPRPLYLPAIALFLPDTIQHTPPPPICPPRAPIAPILPRFRIGFDILF